MDLQFPQYLYNEIWTYCDREISKCRVIKHARLHLSSGERQEREVYRRLKRELGKNKILYRLLLPVRIMINMIVNGRVQAGQFIVVDDKKLVYLSNPKVACSSIKATLIPAKPKGKTVHQATKSLTRDFLTRKEKTYYKFTFVRNPFARLVSCYEDRYIKDQRRIDRGKRDALYFDRYLFGYIKHVESFDEFIRKIVRIPTCLHDMHFYPQYNLIYGRNGARAVDFVGKLKKINEQFKPIQVRFGLMPLPHRNKTKKGDWRDFYTRETAELVRKKYAKDISQFGYEDEYDQLISYIGAKEARDAEK
jgi:hypothetical protein